MIVEILAQSVKLGERFVMCSCLTLTVFIYKAVRHEFGCKYLWYLCCAVMLIFCF